MRIDIHFTRLLTCECHECNRQPASHIRHVVHDIHIRLFQEYVVWQKGFIPAIPHTFNIFMAEFYPWVEYRITLVRK